MVIKKICRECETEMTKKYTEDGVRVYCETCEDETDHDHVEMEAYCPECGITVEFHGKCGTGFYCNKCNSLKSSKKIIWKKV